MSEEKKVVVLAVDGSEHSERALHFYLDNLHKEGNELHVTLAIEYPYVPTQRMYASDPMQPATPYIRKEVLDEIFDQAKKNAHKIEEKYSTVLSQKNIPFKIHLEFSHPGEYICKMAKELKASMVVMGTRGMGSIRRTILGSVSDYVVHHVHCPVLIARH